MFPYENMQKMPHSGALAYFAGKQCGANDTGLQLQMGRKTQITNKCAVREA